MHLRTGKNTDTILFEPVETTSSVNILKLMLTEVNTAHDRHEKIQTLIDIYRYLYQRSEFFMKPQNRGFVSMVLKKSSEFKEDSVKIIGEYQNTMDERVGNAYQLYYYIDAVTREYHTICGSN